jgi:hypothetical protein
MSETDRINEINLMQNKLLIYAFPNAVLSRSDYPCPKIDIFSNGEYLYTTNESKTPKLAKARLLYHKWMDYSLTKITAKKQK